MGAGTVAIRIEPRNGSDEELRGLARWLRAEDEFRGRVDLGAAPLERGHMGGALETVSLLVTSGRKVQLSCGSSDDAEQVINACREFLDRDWGGRAP